MNRAVGGARTGSRITAESFAVQFDGRSYRAQRGDTAASMLAAAGVRVVNRSVKYRRPRGLMACGPEEPNALLTVGEAPRGVPNVAAPVMRVTPNMRLFSQNRWPSLRVDLASLLGLGAGFWGAGFYYKTFMWPSWRTYERLIRRLAGLGFAPGASDLPPGRVLHLEAEVIVAGGGPAGLSAALAAARGGARVLICEREPVAGGELEFEAADIGGLTSTAWVARALAELEALGARILTDTAVVSAAVGVAIAHHQPDGMPGADTLYRLIAPVMINAMGAVERPIAFIDNDRPGIMLAGAAEKMLCRYGVRAGADAVMFGNHDRLYAAALRLRAGGLPIKLIIDVRKHSSSAARATLINDGVECVLDHAVVAAEGKPQLRAVRIAQVGNDAERRVSCDTLLVSGGWSPAVPAARPPEWHLSCGTAAGHLHLGQIVEAAARTGAQALASIGRSPPVPSDALVASPEIAADDGAPNLEPFWRSAASRAGEKRQFVDLQNDVTVADLRQALGEGFRDIEHVKRYTTLGVGTEQGRTGGVLGAAILAELGGTAHAAVGTSRARGPYQPVPMVALSGWRVDAGLRPQRCTPLHELHAADGAELELTGGWMRPRFYRSNGADAFAASLAEAAQVRTFGGICDGSTLGKIEIAGADAAAFLERLYMVPAAKIGIGRARYAALMREDGIVLDDGLLLRLAGERYVATTSSSHLAHVLAHAEFYRDTEWRGRRVALTDVTESWAVIIVAGPSSREWLAAVLGTGWREAIASLPHMSFAERGESGGGLRLLRASFTGEIGFEIHCRPALAPSLWAALAARLRPFGIEALDILRVEKGYLTSSELNGQTAPRDVGLGAMLRDGRDCVGAKLLNRPAFSDPQRPMLVGLHAVDGRSKFLAGAQLTESANANKSVGHVTSAVFSPALGQWVGLALVARRCGAVRTELTARDPLRVGDTPVRVVPTVHFDPRGARIHT